MQSKSKTGSCLRAGSVRLKRMPVISGLLVCLSVLLATPVLPDDAGSVADFTSLDRQIQVLKREVIDLNRDIRLLEEEVLYPMERQLVVFVSLAGADISGIDRVSIVQGERLLVQHEYSASEFAALREGGVHRLFEGRLEPGAHYLDIAFDGKRSNGEAFAIRTLAKITKRTAAKTLELQLHAGNEAQPGIRMSSW